MSQSPHISVSAEVIASWYIPTLGRIELTNAMLSAFVVSVLMIVFGSIMGYQLTKTRKISKTQHFLEGLLLYIRNVTGANLGSNKIANQYLGLTLTLFLFIVLGSWFGLVPGVLDLKYNVNGENVHLLRAPTTDLNACIALAIIAFLTVQIAGFKALGMAYLGKFFTIKGGPMGSVIGLLEFFLEWTRLISYSFRLFGNIFAGEVLIVVLSYLVKSSYIPLPALVILMETGVAMIQGYVLISLMTVFIKMATESHDSHAH